MQVHVELRAVDTTPAQQTCSSSSSDNDTCAAADATSASGSAPAAGVFTRKALQHGQHLAIIPVQLSYMVKPGMGKLVSYCYCIDVQLCHMSAVLRSPVVLGRVVSCNACNKLHM